MKKILMISLVLALLTVSISIVPNAAGAWGKPQIGYDTTALIFEGMVGELQPQTQTIKIWNAGKGTLRFSVKDDAKWLESSPSRGRAADEEVEIEVSVSAAGMDYGTRKGTITIKSLNIGIDDLEIPVEFMVDWPRTMGPTLAGFGDKDTGVPLVINEDGGSFEYAGLNLYMINGPDVYHCPIFDLNQASFNGQFEVQVNYGAKITGKTYTEAGETYTYDYLPITGGQLYGTKNVLKQYWHITDEQLAPPYDSSGEYNPSGWKAEGEIIGGTIVDWASVSQGIPGGGNNNYMVTVHVETGAEDVNGDDPGDFTYKCWLLGEIDVWLKSIVSNVTDMNFHPSLWEEPPEGATAAIQRDLLLAKKLIKRLLMLNSEEITLTVGPFLDALRPAMSLIPDLLSTIKSTEEGSNGSIPAVLFVMQSKYTPCPIIEYTFGIPQDRVADGDSCYRY